MDFAWRRYETISCISPLNNIGTNAIIKFWHGIYVLMLLTERQKSWSDTRKLRTTTPLVTSWLLASRHPHGVTAVRTTTVMTMTMKLNNDDIDAFVHVPNKIYILNYSIDPFKSPLCGWHDATIQLLTTIYPDYNCHFIHFSRCSVIVFTSVVGENKRADIFVYRLRNCHASLPLLLSHCRKERKSNTTGAP